MDTKVSFKYKDLNTGWTCPKCGRCYSPSIVECSSCNNEIKVNFPPGFVIPLTDQLCCHSHDFEIRTNGRVCKKCGFLPFEEIYIK